MTGRRQGNKQVAPVNELEEAPATGIEERAATGEEAARSEIDPAGENADVTRITPPERTPEQRVRVIRGIPCGGGKVIEPGNVLTVGKDLPFHRIRQFIEQRYVMALDPDRE